MATDIVQVRLAVINHLLDNWAETPICETGAGGVDITGAEQGCLFDLDVDFIEISINTRSRYAAGVSCDSGIRVFAYLDVQLYTPSGNGTIRLTELESQLSALVGRRSLGGAVIRSASNVSAPYEFRGRLTKLMSFPIEFYETK